MSTPSTLDTWMEQERAVKVRQEAGPGPGVARPEHLAGLSGLQAMQALIDGTIPFASIAKTLDFIIVEVSPGRCVVQGSPGAAHLNPLGTIHGGWYATLLDSALGCAVHTVLQEGQGYTTAQLSVNYVRAVNPAKTPRVRVEGKVIHAGRQMATSEARVYGPDDTLYAHATCTCLIFDVPKKA